MEPQPEEDMNKLDLSPNMEEAWLEVAMYYKHLLMFGDLQLVNLLCPKSVKSCQVVSFITISSKSMGNKASRWKEDEYWPQQAYDL